MLEMTGILQIVMDNSEVILMIISILLALIARYFQTQASAIAEAIRAVADLTQAALDAVKDGVISKDELTVIIGKIQVAQADIQAVIDEFFKPATPTEKLSAIVFGYKREQLSTLKVKVQNMQMMKRK